MICATEIVTCDIDIERFFVFLSFVILKFTIRCIEIVVCGSEIVNCDIENYDL